ncbi:unnamed protein product [Ectocarpus sp. 12 AP-2014]
MRSATPLRTIDSTRRILLDFRKTSQKRLPFPTESSAVVGIHLGAHHETSDMGAPHGKRRTSVNHAKTTW